MLITMRNTAESLVGMRLEGFLRPQSVQYIYQLSISSHLGGGGGECCILCVLRELCFSINLPPFRYGQGEGECCILCVCFALEKERGWCFRSTGVAVHTYAVSDYIGERRNFRRL